MFPNLPPEVPGEGLGPQIRPDPREGRSSDYVDAATRACAEEVDCILDELLSDQVKALAADWKTWSEIKDLLLKAQAKVLKFLE